MTPVTINSQQSTPAVGAPLVEVRAITKNFAKREVLRNLSLEIASGEFLTLLGESGSGKTTLLRLIAGFEQPTSGEIWMSQTRLDSLPAHKRPINTVFQHYALFPHLSVRDNVAYGPRVKNTPHNEIPVRVDEALRMVKMSEYADTRPSKLSGGQQQRIALARALVNRPQLLLLDEPLSALDANLRKQMQSELKLLQRKVGITFLFITHDQEEAMALSDRIALLRNGALEQIATPRDIYQNPSTAYTAQFIGQTNLLNAQVINGTAICGNLTWPTLAPNGSTTFSLRPEAIELTTSISSSQGAISFVGTIRQQIYGGSTELLEVDCGANQLLRVRVPACGPLTGQQSFSFNPADAIPVRAEK